MEDILNLHSLLAISVGVAFQFMLVLSLFMFYRGKRNRLYKLLGCVFLFWGIVGLRNILLMTFNINFSIWTKDVSLIVEMLTVPVSVAFLIELVIPNSISIRKFTYVMLPYALMLLSMVFLQVSYVLLILFCISIVYALISFLITVITIPKYETWLKNNYSNSEHFSVTWLWLIVIAFFVMFALWIVSVFNYEIKLEIIYNFLKPLCWSIVLYFLYRQRRELNNVSNKDFMNSVYGVNLIKEDRGDAISTDDNDKSEIESHYLLGFDMRLEKSFVEPKLFLNKSLTMSDLALELNTNRTYLSYYFNKVLHVTFYDYVNEYRLEYASQMLLNNHEMTIEEVGECSGFNSLSTFRRSFYKYFGCNPKEYRKKNNISEFQ